MKTSHPSKFQLLIPPSFLPPSAELKPFSEAKPATPIPFRCAMNLNRCPSMTTSSALSPSLRHLPLPPSISFSPLSLRRHRGSVLASALPPSPGDSVNSAEGFDFWPRSRKRPDRRTPDLDVVASSALTSNLLSYKSLQAVAPVVNEYHTEAMEPPPDVESQLLFSRCVYICLPLVPLVSEMVVGQLLYLQAANPYEPIYMHVSSTGTVRDDNEPIALESEGFAIYDTMMSLRNEVHTVLSYKAVGPACLLIAAGTKGKRYMMPSGRALLQEPRVPAYGEMPTSDLVRRTREAMIQKKTLIELLARHTGNSFEKVQEMMKRSCYMNFEEAKEFGLVDKMVERGKDQLMANTPSLGQWEKRKKIIAHKNRL